MTIICLLRLLIIAPGTGAAAGEGVVWAGGVGGAAAVVAAAGAGEGLAGPFPPLDPLTDKLMENWPLLAEPLPLPPPAPDPELTGLNCTLDVVVPSV